MPKKEKIFYRLMLVCRVVLGLIVVAAMLGVMGEGWMSARTLDTTDYHLEYEKVVRSDRLQEISLGRLNKAVEVSFSSIAPIQIIETRPRNCRITELDNTISVKSPSGEGDLRIFYKTQSSVPRSLALTLISDERVNLSQIILP